MGLATPHQAFPLCPAKLIQEWLSSSDSISRQNKSASLNTPSALIGLSMEGKKWLGKCRDWILTDKGCCTVVEQRVYSSYMQGALRSGKYETQPCSQTCSLEKKHTDIWRALKPQTFTALALKLSNSIKSAKSGRQRRQLIGEKGRKRND